MPVELTQAQIDQVQNFIRENTDLMDQGCPACGSRLEVMDTPVITQMVPENRQDSPAGLPMVLLVCSDCHRATPYMLARMGIEVGQEAQTT